MPDPRDSLERQMNRVQLRPFTVDAFHRRRERKHRNQRLRAGALALAIAVGGTGVAVRAFQAEPATHTPAHHGTKPPSTTGGTAVSPAPVHTGTATQSSPPGQIAAAPIHVHDGSIAYVGSTAANGAGIFLYDPRSGSTRTLVSLGCSTAAGRHCVGSQIRGIAWSPDGTKLAFSVAGSAETTAGTQATFGDGIWVFDLHTGDVRRISPCGTTTCVEDDTLAWAPGGDTIAFTRASTNGYPRIWTMGADGSHAAPLDTGGVTGQDPSFLPDGTAIVFAGSSGGLYTTTLATDHHTFPIDLGAPMGQGALFGPSYSPSGQEIAYGEHTGCGPDGHLWVYSVASQTSTKFDIGGGSCGPPLESPPAWSPDGVEIAFGIGNEIDLIKADGTNLQRFTHGFGYPAWFPSR